MKKIICFLIGLHITICSLLNGSVNWISGHEYEIKYENDDVQILKCTRCGNTNVGYLHNLEEGQ